MAVRFYVSTEEASFFNNNRMGYGDSIPREGFYKVGDFIISSTQADGIFGWVCTVAGEPGEWEVIGSGNVGGGSSSSQVVGYYNTVTFSDARNTIEIGIEDYDSTKDFLEVHYNGLLLAEGVHYTVSENSIVKMEGFWNLSAYEDQQMIFRVLKSEGMNIKQLKNTINVDNATFSVEIGIPEYKSNDILEAHLNGVLLVEGLDYNIQNGCLVKIDQSEAWNPYDVEGQKMFIKVLQNKGKLIGPNDLEEDLRNDMEVIGDMVNIVEEFNDRIAALESGGNLNEVEERVGDLESDVSNLKSSSINRSELGSLSDLTTENKSNVVSAINEVFQFGNNVKQKLVDALIAMGKDASTSESFDSLIGKLEGVKPVTKHLKVRFYATRRAYDKSTGGNVGYIDQIVAEGDTTGPLQSTTGFAEFSFLTSGCDGGFNGTKSRMFCSNGETKTILEFDPDTLGILKTKVLPYTPRGVAAGFNGEKLQLFIMNDNPKEVYEVDPDTFETLQTFTNNVASFGYPAIGAAYDNDQLKLRMFAMDWDASEYVNYIELDPSNTAIIKSNRINQYTANNFNNDIGGDWDENKIRLLVNRRGNSKRYEIDPDSLAVIATWDVENETFGGMGGCSDIEYNVEEN